MDSDKMIIEKLLKNRPKRDFVFTAIEELSEKDDILAFYEEYIIWMKENWAYGEENSPRGITWRQCVDQNIGYILGYYDKSVRELWYSTLPVSHPVFGNNY